MNLKERVARIAELEGELTLLRSQPETAADRRSRLNLQLEALTERRHDLAVDLRAVDKSIRQVRRELAKRAT